jgi:hypothetical protein
VRPYYRFDTVTISAVAQKNLECRGVVGKVTVLKVVEASPADEALVAFLAQFPACRYNFVTLTVKSVV